MAKAKKTTKIAKASAKATVRRYRYVMDDIAKDWAKRYKAGESLAVIGKSADRNASVVRGVLLRIGVTLRPRGGAPGVPKKPTKAKAKKVSKPKAKAPAKAKRAKAGAPVAS